MQNMKGSVNGYHVGFADYRRLRRSGVAKQHVSAHFAVAKRTLDFN
jgi:hypothetical protein